MRIATFLCVLVIATVSSLAQGTTSFRVALDGAHAAPPNGSTRTGFGEFTLDAALLFSGFVGLEQYIDVTSVSIFQSSSGAQVGTLLYNFTPGGIVSPGPSGEPGSRQFDFARTLSANEVANLQAGQWFVGVLTPEFPNGVIRGKITVVPEPGVSALLALGLAGLFARRALRSTVQL